MSQETPLFARTYDLLAYLLPATDKFPRSWRLGLGRRASGLLAEVGKLLGSWIK